MISPQDIEKLATLARIKITDEERDQFGHEIDSILSYVNEIQSAAVDMNLEPQPGAVKNVMRSDAPAIEEAKYTEKILADAPRHEGSFIKVKKIL